MGVSIKDLTEPDPIGDPRSAVSRGVSPVKHPAGSSRSRQCTADHEMVQCDLTRPSGAAPQARRRGTKHKPRVLCTDIPKDHPFDSESKDSRGMVDAM